MSKYKVGDEFIVKIKEVIDSYNGTLYRSNFSTLVFDDYGLDNLDNVATSANIAVDKAKAYQKGLNDAWELARKIENKLDIPTAREIFGAYRIADILDNFRPQEALAKIEAYEESKAIKVGDVVETGGNLAVVVSFGTFKVKDDSIHVVYFDGVTNCLRKDNKSIKKTGRHIDIEHLLEQIRGNE